MQRIAIVFIIWNDRGKKYIGGTAKEQCIGGIDTREPHAVCSVQLMQRNKTKKERIMYSYIGEEACSMRSEKEKDGVLYRRL